MPSSNIVDTVSAGLRSAHEMALELRKCENADALREGIDEIATKLLDVRTETLKLQEQVNVLKRRAGSAANIRAMDALAFDRSIDNYVRRDTAGGGFVYVERENMANSPLFCAHCFGKRHLSILQPTVIERMLRCPL